MIDFCATRASAPFGESAGERSSAFSIAAAAPPARICRSAEDFEAKQPYSVGTPILCSWAGCMARERRSGMVAEMLAAGLNPIAAAAITSASKWSGRSRDGPRTVRVSRRNADGPVRDRLLGPPIFSGLLVARDAAMTTRFAARALSHQAGSSSLMPPFTPMLGRAGDGARRAGSAHAAIDPADSDGAMCVDLLRAAIERDLCGRPVAFSHRGNSRNRRYRRFDPLQRLALAPRNLPSGLHVDGASARWRRSAPP